MTAKGKYGPKRFPPKTVQFYHFSTLKVLLLQAPKDWRAEQCSEKKNLSMMLSRLMYFIMISAVLSACGSLEKRSALINPGDTKEKVLAVMGAPGDRQFRGRDEAWQYGQTGAGFGCHDFRVVWFYDGKVTGLNSYKDYTPASSAAAHFKPIRWENAPDRTIEIRQR